MKTQRTQEVYLLTTSIWNPHYKAYSSNEERILDWEGKLIGKK